MFDRAHAVILKFIRKGKGKLHLFALCIDSSGHRPLAQQGGVFCSRYGSERNAKRQDLRVRPLRKKQSEMKRAEDAQVDEEKKEEGGA